MSTDKRDFGRHFLMLSKKYQESKGSGRFGSDEILQRRTIVSRFLDDYFTISSWEKTTREIQEEAKKAGIISVSRATVNNDIFLLKTARQYLLSSSNDQIKIRKENSKKAWLIFALDCLDDDGITSWKQVEEMYLALDKTDKPAKAPETITGKRSGNPLAESSTESIESIWGLNDSLQEIFLKICHTVPNGIQELTNSSIGLISSLKKENMELLDKNRGLSEAYRIINEQLQTNVGHIAILSKEAEHRNRQLEENAARLFDLEKLLVEKDRELEKTHKELARIKAENGERIAQLVKENRRLALSFSSEIIKRALAYEELSGEVNETSNQSAPGNPDSSLAEPNHDLEFDLDSPPAKKTIENLLPETYTPTGGKVVPEDCFISFMKRLGKSGRGQQEDILSKINTVCQLGIDAVPFNIKTISDSSKNTPANSQQVRSGKYRIMMGLREGDLILYEGFHRKESPYGSLRN